MRPRINPGIPTHRVHTLNSCPKSNGSNQPIRRGNPSPIRSPNSRSCFLEITSFMINRVQTPASRFHLFQLWVVHSYRGFGFEEPIYSFVPSIGISDLILIPKKFSLAWENNFFIASLIVKNLSD